MAVAGATGRPPRLAARRSGIDGALARQALSDGSWGQYHGPWCRRLEQLLAASHGAEHVLLASSGTAAVELALRGLGVGPGDEVILSAYDFKGNFQDVLSLGAVPVLVDVRPDDWMLDVDQVASGLAKDQGDCGLASAWRHGQHAGTDYSGGGSGNRGARRCLPGAAGAGRWPARRDLGRRGCLEFRRQQTCDGGAGRGDCDARADIAQRIRLYVRRGNDAYPLSELQAAAVIPQWKMLEACNRQRADAVAWLLQAPPRDETGQNATTPTAGRGLPGLFPVAPRRPDCRPVYYKWGLRFDSLAFDGLTRDQFAQAARAEGLAFDPGLRALHKTHSSRRFRAGSSLDEAARADSAMLTLHHPILLRDGSELAEVRHTIFKLQQSVVALRDWFAANPQTARWKLESD